MLNRHANRSFKASLPNHWPTQIAESLVERSADSPVEDPADQALLPEAQIEVFDTHCYRLSDVDVSELDLIASDLTESELSTSELIPLKTDLSGIRTDTQSLKSTLNINRSSSDLTDARRANNPTIDTHVNCFNQPSGVFPENALGVQSIQRLRQVERKVRSSLELSSILGAAVVESASLLSAQQVILLRYESEVPLWIQAAQYCQNQAIAWQQRCTIVQSEFPDLTRQLLQGKALQIYTDQPLPTTETRQWLACWPGNWLLVPVKKNQYATYSLNEQQTNQSAILRSAGKAAATIDTQAAAEHWGIMALALPGEQTWTAEAIISAQSIAVELSLALAQADQHQSLLAANQALQKLALLDGLTSLANRRRFDEHLADEWQRLARDQQPLSLILCDLDHFKRYNDTFGHPAGDRCLKKIAQALSSGPQRPADLVARYGGEEFAIILPNTDTNGAWRIAQKLHSSIRALRIAHAADNDKPYVTVTMGVSTIVPGHESTAQILVQAADLALYHAKKQGRDRTYVHAHYNTVNPEAAVASNDSQPAMTPPEETL